MSDPTLGEAGGAHQPWPATVATARREQMR